MSSRIKQAAKHAGLGEGFIGHFPRVGMAIDLARYGIEFPRLMVAGRWRSPMMPAHYTRNESVSREQSRNTTRLAKAGPSVRGSTG